MLPNGADDLSSVDREALERSSATSSVDRDGFDWVEIDLGGLGRAISGEASYQSVVSRSNRDEVIDQAGARRSIYRCVFNRGGGNRSTRCCVIDRRGGRRSNRAGGFQLRGLAVPSTAGRDGVAGPASPGGDGVGNHAGDCARNALAKPGTQHVRQRGRISRSGRRAGAQASGITRRRATSPPARRPRRSTRWVRGSRDLPG